MTKARRRRADAVATHLGPIRLPSAHTYRLIRFLTTRGELVVELDRPTAPSGATVPSRPHLPSAPHVSSLETISPSAGAGLWRASRRPCTETRCVHPDALIDRQGDARRVGVSPARGGAGGPGAGQGDLARLVVGRRARTAAGPHRRGGAPLVGGLQAGPAQLRSGRSPRRGRAGRAQPGGLRAARPPARRRRRVGDHGQRPRRHLRQTSPRAVGLPRRGVPRRRPTW